MVPFLDRSLSRAITTISRRFLDGLLTVWAAVTITFFALRIVAGDPLSNLLSQGLATQEQLESMREVLGLDRSLPVQYMNFLLDLLRGRLGRSLYTGQPVVDVIFEQLPSTLALATGALILAVILGFFLGILAAWKKGSTAGTLAEGTASLATALPVAFTGILAILLFTLFISRSGGSLSIKTHVLPVLVLGFASAGAIARVVQSGLEESIQSPYMLAARARGIRSTPRLLWHAVRPILPPVISLIALEMAFLFAGTVITETVFSRPGLGRLLVNSILQGDYPVAQGLVILAALFYTFSHLIADVLAMLIDPRMEGRT
ncbi:MAG: ABC transporter permease subunit [Anaerolineales bacterium]|nr:ABC transporter permease subunit [Anaerolineales bacterium]